MNMNIFGCSNVRKHREITDSDNYITLYISLKFGSLDNMRITSSEPKDYLGRSRKGLITSLGINNIVMPNKNKKSKYAIINGSMKCLSNIIKEFEKLFYNGYVLVPVSSNHGNIYVKLLALVLGIYGVPHAKVNGIE